MGVARKSWLLWLILGAVAALAGGLAIRVGWRLHVLRQLQRIPQAQARLSIRPTQRAFATHTQQHAVNLGYAVFDMGVEAPLFSLATGTAVFLTNRNAEVLFLRPFTKKPHSPKPGADARVEAFARLLEEFPIQAESRIEQAQVPSLLDLARMSTSEFTFDAVILGEKAGYRFGFSEVYIFTTPTITGIARIGETPQDRQTAIIFICSLDGSKRVGSRVTTSPGKDVAEIVDPLLASFRFTIAAIDDAEIKAAITKAGIQQRQVAEGPPKPYPFPVIRNEAPLPGVRR